LGPHEILQAAQFVFAFVFEVADVVYVLPRIVVYDDVVVEVDGVLAEV
jgi:hypothetical protein